MKKSRFLWDGYEYCYDVCLFGSMTNWRDKFIKKYKREGITFYTPQKKDWTEREIPNEIAHLDSLRSRVVIFAVCKETYSLQTLKEILYLLKRFEEERIFRFMLFYIEPTPDEQLKINDEKLWEKSKKLRKKVMKKILKINDKPWGREIHICDSLEVVLSLSLIYYSVVPYMRTLFMKRDPNGSY